MRTARLSWDDLRREIRRWPAALVVVLLASFALHPVAAASAPTVEFAVSGSSQDGSADLLSSVPEQLLGVEAQSGSLTKRGAQEKPAAALPPPAAGSLRPDDRLVGRARIAEREPAPRPAPSTRLTTGPPARSA